MNKKPVVFVQGDRTFYRENKYVQNILLKAMSNGITDPQELRKLAGLKSAAEVFRTLDKLAIRKEYHDALFRNGITLDKVISEIKSIGEGDNSASVKLKAWQTILRSVGLDKYEKLEETGKGWEEAIIEASDAVGTDEGEAGGDETVVVEYDIDRPSMPEEERAKREAEREFSKELYGEDHSQGPGEA